MLTKQSTLILPGPASLRAGNHSNSGKGEETIEQTGQLGCLENNFIKHREKKLWQTNRQEKLPIMYSFITSLCGVVTFSP